MTSLAPSPLWVALVQTASTLPVFLLGLPSGAMADTLDRRRHFIFTQFWVAIVAALLCAVILLKAMNPPLLLTLTFFNGIGLAMRGPQPAAFFAPSRDSLPCSRRPMFSRWRQASSNAMTNSATATEDSAYHRMRLPNR